MNNVITFTNEYFDKAISLKKDFKVLEKKTWDELSTLCELTVQVGHLYNFFLKDEEVSEKGRSFSSFGDELCDVILQLYYLCYLMDIKLDDLDKYEEYTYENSDGIIILCGQLNEAVLEVYKYRFDKKHEDYDDTMLFIKDRISKILKLVINVANKFSVSLAASFDEMIMDSHNFIEKRLNGGKN